MLAAYDLRAVPCYPEARRIRTDPIVSVPSNSKVAETGRIFLRTPIHWTLATVYVDGVRAFGHRLMCGRRGNHNFVVPRAERSEVVTFLTDHDAGILSCRSKECKPVANFGSDAVWFRGRAAVLWRKICIGTLLVWTCGYDASSMDAKAEGTNVLTEWFAICTIGQVGVKNSSIYSSVYIPVSQFIHVLLSQDYWRRFDRIRDALIGVNYNFKYIFIIRYYQKVISMM